MRSKRPGRKVTLPHRWRGRPGILGPAVPRAKHPRKHEAPAAAPSRTVDTFFGGLAQRLGLPAGANLVFGERVEHDGVVVIPVAKASWGMGGGIDAAKDAGGGGGGATVRPFGYVQMSNGDARFHRIFSPANAAAVVLAGTVGTALMLRALGRLLAAIRSGPENV